MFVFVHMRLCPFLPSPPLTRKLDVEEGGTSSDEGTLSVDDDDYDDEGRWIEPSQAGGNLPASVRRRLVPTVSGGSWVWFRWWCVFVGACFCGETSFCRDIWRRFFTSVAGFW